MVGLWRITFGWPQESPSKLSCDSDRVTLLTLLSLIWDIVEQWKQHFEELNQHELSKVAYKLLSSKVPDVDEVH